MGYNAFIERIELEKMLINELKKKHSDTRKLEYLLIQHKREYRRSLKVRADKHYETYTNGFVVNGGGSWEDRWIKVFFPGEQWAEEEKLKFIDDNWKECRYSAYDCTGDVFTWAIDCFNVPAGVVCYIREAIDV